MCRQLISSLLFDYHTGAVRPGSHLGFCHLHFRLEIRAVVLVNQQCKQRALQVTAEQVHEEPVFQIATDVALPQAHQLYLPSSTSALRIRLDVLLYLCGHIRTHPLVVVHGAVIIKLQYLALVRLEIIEELIGQLTHGVRRQCIEFFEYTHHTPTTLPEHHGKHIAGIHACLQRFILIQVPEHRTVLLPPERVLLYHFIQESVRIEVLHREVTIEHLACLQLGDNGKDVAKNTFQSFSEFIAEPVFTQYIHVNIGGRDEEERYAPACLNPALLPALHVLACKHHGTFCCIKLGLQ